MARIAVVGSGITGITSAYALVRAGHEVTVIDRHRYPAMETSFANGGQLSASNAEVWNSWGTILKGLRWMTQPSAPLLLNPRPSWHKLSWLAEFCGQIGNYRAHSIQTARLAIAAREHLFRVAEEEDIAFDLERRGILHVYHDAAGFRQADRANALLREAGLDRYPVTPAEIAQIEPALNGTFHGGFFTPSDSTGDIHKFTRGLAAACERRGAALRLGAGVERIVAGEREVRLELAAPDGGTLICDRLVVCAGVESRRLAASLGDRVNIYPVKGYSITVALNDEASRAAAPWVSLLDESAKIVTSRLGADRFRVAGTAEFNGYNRDIRDDRIRPLVAWTERLFPGVETDAVVPWAGLRPMTPSMMPVVRAGRNPRVLYNTGHGHLGWTLSAATAEMLRGLLDGE
ncbi:D-amino-acid dehydrogenase [Sphingobium sp. SYK-6]|uniref:D-amino acid dehydrogenase n=1 Tax=Sphingobium sp. (strain NBRC 103272 / SYK-6) TaxID=627192 RepID=UPI00022768F2|nr:D-amino acid dehydrogenase [Sphingobium sp. SYK-6]BAK64688.1 D-amino-acid dehydrogenase [Sphingobium sp. SYK-6]